MRKYFKLLVPVLLVLVLCTGCKDDKRTQVVATWGLSSDELFRVENESMKVAEARILLLNQMAGYRNLYGEAVLTRSYGDRTLEDTMKDNTLSLLGKIMVMDRMADKYQIHLTEEELALTETASKEYMESLSEEERSTVNASEKDVRKLYERILLADRVFEELTGEENIEISDDEARVVTLRHIMIKTTEPDENGVLKNVSGAKKQESYTKSLEIFDKLQQGADFDALAGIYNEDVRTEYSVGRGELALPLEEAVFEMESGELSIVLESAEGYHIILCVNNFDREATEINKAKMTARRKWDIFEETYNSFATELDCEFNDKQWEALGIESQDAVTGSFLEIYRDYFSKTE